MYKLIALGIALCGCVCSQPPLRFDAAVLRVDTSHDGATGEFKNGRLIIHNQNLRTLIGYAYDVPNPQVDGPAWLDQVRLDAVAKTSPATTEDESRLMLQSLLVEQLELRVRRAQKIEAAYSMVAARGGVKIQKSPPEIRLTNCAVVRAGSVKCQAVALAAFASFLPQLGGEVDCPASDATGLPGLYQIDLTWNAAPDGPSIFEAMEEQLGLRLEPRKLPVDYLVVEHAERAPVGQ